MKPNLPIVLLAAIAALTPLSVDMYLPAIPGIAEFLSTDINTIQNSLSTFLIGFGLGMMIYGPISDRMGRRPLALFGLSGFCLASLLISFSPNGTSFLIFRFMQGILGSAATVVVPAIVRDVFGKNTAKGMSSVSMIMLIAPLVGPLVGSLLLTVGTWQIIFQFLSLYSFTMLIIAWRILPETRPDDDPDSRRTFLGSYKVIMSRKRVYFDILSSLLAALAFFAYLTSCSFIYITYFGASETLFGFLFASSAFSLIVANLIINRFVDKLGPRKMLFLGMCVSTIFALVMVLLISIEAGLYWVVACFFMIIGGLGVSWINADSLVLIEFPQQASSASAVLGTFRFGTGALAGPILAAFYTGTPLPASLLIVSCIGVALLVQTIRGALLGFE